VIDVSAPTRSGGLAGAELQALGTTARVVVDGGSIDDARALLVEELDAIDRACSRFRDDSELMAVNRADGRPVVIGPVLVEAVEVALRAARLTEGRVDPTVGRALVVLGYDRDFDELERLGPPLVVRTGRVPGWQAVELDHDRSTLRVPAGVLLDLGATAKALAADRAAHRIAAALGCGVLVSLGGDVSLAGPRRAGGWPIEVTDDHAGRVTDPRETVSLASGGLATSSTTVRWWARGDEVRHHVVDPASGRPADGPFRTVSVAAGACVDANVASTAALVLGEDAPRWLAHVGLPARLVDHDGRVTHTGGWGAPHTTAMEIA
jgi:thiamine biosynthesis lipoprotein